MQKRKYGLVDNGGDNPFESLAFAIIIQAAEEYVILLNANDEYARKKARELERFFRSDWFGTLTPADPERFIKLLKKSVSQKSSGTDKPTPKIIDGYLSVKEAAKFVNENQNKIYKALRQGQLHGIKANGIFQIARKELDKYKRRRDN